MHKPCIPQGQKYEMFGRYVHYNRFGNMALVC